MFRKVLIIVMLAMSSTISNSTFADNGMLTAQYRDKLRNNGCYFIKYNDYTQTDMLASMGYQKKKRKPSAIVSVAQYKDKRFRESIGINISKYTGRIVDIEKDGKHYRLDCKRKSGILYKAPSENNVMHMQSSNGMFLEDQMQPPTALTFLIPNELKTKSMKHDADTYKFKRAYDVEIDGVTFRCEEFGINTLQLQRVYKLYYKEGVISKYAHGDRIAEVLEVKPDFDTNIFSIPEGFTIYSYNSQVLQNPNKGMDDLLKNKSELEVVEQY